MLSLRLKTIGFAFGLFLAGAGICRPAETETTYRVPPAIHLTRLRFIHIAGDVEQKGLTGLSLAGHKEVTDSDLPILQKLKNLKMLDLSGTGITDAGVGLLNSLTHLQELHLDNTAVTDKGLEKLRLLQSLEIVSAKCTDTSAAVLGSLTHHSQAKPDSACTE